MNFSCLILMQEKNMFNLFKRKQEIKLLKQKEKELNNQKEQMEYLPQEVQEQIKKRISRNRSS